MIWSLLIRPMKVRGGMEGGKCYWSILQTLLSFATSPLVKTKLDFPRITGVTTSNTILVQRNESSDYLFRFEIQRQTWGQLEMRDTTLLAVKFFEFPTRNWIWNINIRLLVKFKSSNKSNVKKLSALCLEQVSLFWLLTCYPHCYCGGGRQERHSKLHQPGPQQSARLQNPAVPRSV